MCMVLFEFFLEILGVAASSPNASPTTHDDRAAPVGCQVQLLLRNGSSHWFAKSRVVQLQETCFSPMFLKNTEKMKNPN